MIDVTVGSQALRVPDASDSVWYDEMDAWMIAVSDQVTQTSSSLASLSASVSSRPQLRYVGAVGEPAFENSWQNFTTDPAVGVPAGFYRDSAGTVHLQGAISAGSQFTSVFTLPDGLRPSGSLFFAAQSQNGSSTFAIKAVKVSGSGEVLWFGSVNTINYLDGVSFRASGSV